MDDSSTRHSSESVAIHKLGFDMIADTRRPLASVMNRVSAVPAFANSILRIIGFIQFLAYGTACTVPSVFDDSRFSKIIKDILIFFQRFYFDSTSETAIIVLLFMYLLVIAFWLILHFRFNYQYNKIRVFSRLLVRILHFIGMILIPFIIPPMASTCCYFVRPLFEIGGTSANLYAFVGIGTFSGYFYLINIIIECVQSSPNMDIKDSCCMWPTESFLLKFRIFFLMVFAFVAEFFVKFDNWSFYIINVFGIVGSVIGFYFVWTQDCHILQLGRTISAAEYFVLFSFSLFTLIHGASHVQSIYMAACALVITIVLIIIESRVQYSYLRNDIDLLYLPFEDMTEKISSPYQCVHLMKLGLVYTVPCITNQMLQNWSLTRWPNDQDLMIFCFFLSFVQHAPYMEILDMLSTAVDIKPFTTFHDLLAYQIFVRLPTQENKLKLRLERIRKLYEIPQQSLLQFWGAVTRRHWDEAYIHCSQLHEETNRIFNMFANLIFENPNYDFVMIEFRRFVEEIQGNVQLANAVEQEVARRKTEIKASSQVDTGSIAQLTRASSIRSTIFLSEFSDNQTPIEKVQSSIYSSVEARPIYSPSRFVLISSLLALVAAILNIIVLILVKNNRRIMQKNTSLAVQLHLLSELAGETLASSLEFISVNSGCSLNPNGFNLTTMRSKLDSLTLSFDSILAGVYSFHSSLPTSFMRSWIDNLIETPMISPEMEMVNMSFIDVIRLLQVRARTISMSPESSLGNLSNPSIEIEQVSLLFPAASEALSQMISQLCQLVFKSDKEMELYINVAIFSFCSAGFVTTLAFAAFLIYMIRKEFNFFLDIYSFVPIKVLQRLVDTGDSATAVVIDESEIHMSSNMKQQRPPLLAYQIPQVVATFVVLYVLLSVPSLLFFISHTNHIKEARNVVSGYELSAELVLTVSKLYLSAFRVISSFPSPNNPTEDLRSTLVDLEAIIANYQSLLYGDEVRFPTGLIVSKPDEVVKLLHETCNSVTQSRTKDEKCTSFDTDINFVYSHIHRLVSSPSNFAAQGIDGGWWQLFYPVMNKIIIKETPKFREVFTNFVIKVRRKASIMDIISIVIIVLFMIGIPITTYLLSHFKMQPNFSLLLKPMILMFPECIAESPFLLHFLQGDFDRPSRATNREKLKGDGDNSTPLIDFILEGILILSPDGTIVASNRKYHEMVLSSPEEVLGVPVKNLFNNDLNSIFEAIDKLREGTTAPFQSISAEASIFSSDDRELEVRISLIAQTKHNGRLYRATALALIITDRSELIKAQTQLRKEKANVEELLDQILPHLIAVSLLNGQNDISFDVERACILFSDIVSFTPLCSSKSAKEIITTLNNLFTEFDSALGMVNRVTKLKTIGDAYVCAAGLFEGDGPIEEAAKEIVKLGLTMLDIIPRINQQLQLKLQMRIGIHTGGPLICGVLGKEKPLFEAIGNVVTIAEELENTSLPDRVHISQDTADLVTPLELKLQERGNNVTISGLGNQHTYIILPPVKEKDT